MAILTTEQQGYYAAGGDHGNYRYISLAEIIDSFTATYVGNGKICENVAQNDVNFHAIRALQELSYDTLKSVKDWEIEVPATLVMVMPVDYVNYVKLSWSDGAGMEHVIYPISKTSNPKNIKEDILPYGGFEPDANSEDLSRTLDDDLNDTSDTRINYANATPSEANDDYEDDVYWPYMGGRHGIDPQFAQVNGSFFIDEDAGKFHFSSNLSGKTLILKYISDGLVTADGGGNLDLDSTFVPKLAEEALYKHMLYGILLARKDTQGGLLAEVKKQKYAETRKAKLRLSNIKIEELTRILRGSSKIIKH